MEPYYEHDGVTVLNGHVLNVLRDMEPESVQMCVTSPPYWGLRDYGLEPQIWYTDEYIEWTAGGETHIDKVNQEGCEHVWGDESIKIYMPKRDHDGAKSFGDTRGQEPSRKAFQTELHQGHFCQHCGAWRGSLGLEPTPELYVKHITAIFREVRRVLKKDGTCWLNLGDSYTSGNRTHRRDPDSKNIPALQTFNRVNTPPGLKPKDLCMIPARVALALQADGWWLRSDIIWNKPNPMPESVTDRPTKAHEYVFLLTKAAKYYYDADAVREELTTPLHSPGNKPRKGEVMRNDFGTDRMDATWGNEKGRNKRSVWTVATQPFPEAHFAVFPEKLIEPCILAGSRIGDTVLDPFGGSGTTARVSKRLNRKAIIIELNSEYCEMSLKDLAQGNFNFGES